MSLARWPVYVWSDGHKMHLWVKDDAPEKVAYPLEGPESYKCSAGIAIDMKLWEEFVAVAWAAIVHEGQAKRVLKRCMNPKSATHGNFTGFALRELMGGDPMEEYRQKMEEAAAERERREADGAVVPDDLMEEK